MTWCLCGGPPQPKCSPPAASNTRGEPCIHGMTDAYLGRARAKITSIQRMIIIYIKLSIIYTFTFFFLNWYRKKRLLIFMYVYVMTFLYFTYFCLCCMQPKFL